MQRNEVKKQNNQIEFEDKKTKFEVLGIKYCTKCGSELGECQHEGTDQFSLFSNYLD